MRNGGCMFRSLCLFSILVFSLLNQNFANAALELFELRLDGSSRAIIEMKSGFTSANEIIQMVDAKLDGSSIELVRQGDRLWLSHAPIESGDHTLNLRLNIADKNEYESVSSAIVNLNARISIIKQRLKSEQDPAVRKQLLAEHKELKVERRDLIVLQSGLKKQVISENHIFAVGESGLQVQSVECVSGVGRAFGVLRVDSATYSLGDRGLLTVSTSILPDNENFEIAHIGYFSNKKVAVDKLTDSEAVAFSPDLTEIGEFSWKIDFYLQDRYKAIEYNEAILKLEKLIDSTNRQIARELDPVLKDLLIQEKAELNQELQIVKRQLNSIRVKVDSHTLDITVGEKGFELLSLFGSLLLKNSFNHANLIYRAGETVEYTIQVISGFIGNDGKQEIVIRGQLGGEKQSLVKESDYFYNGQTQLSEDAQGEQTFVSRLYVRSKVRADSVKVGIAKAEEKLIEYMHLRAEGRDTIMEQYYDRKVTEMEKVVANYYRILEQMLEQIAFEKTILTIDGSEPPVECVEGDVTDQFVDDGFALAIRRTLGMRDGDPICLERLGEIEDFNAPDRDVWNVNALDGIGLLPNLRSLVLYGNPVESIEALAELTQPTILGYININDTLTEDLNPLVHIKDSLGAIHLWGTNVTSFQVFTDNEFPVLNDIMMHNNRLGTDDCDDLLPLYNRGMLGALHDWQWQRNDQDVADHLTCVTLETDVTASFFDDGFKSLIRAALGLQEEELIIYAERLPEIRYLHVEYYEPKITDIGSLAGIEQLSNLRSLGLSENPGLANIDSLLVFAGQLDGLDISNTGVTDVDVLSHPDFIYYMWLDISNMYLDNEDCGAINHFRRSGWLDGGERWISQINPEDGIAFDLNCPEPLAQ